MYDEHDWSFSDLKYTACVLSYLLGCYLTLGFGVWGNGLQLAGVGLIIGPWPLVGATESPGSVATEIAPAINTSSARHWFSTMCNRYETK